MNPVFIPRLVDPPREPDVIVIGAGAAGIAAARTCLGAGLSVAVVEARDRVGGRAVTVDLRGHAVDLGAHWLHGGDKNPLTVMAKAAGEPVRPAGGGARQLFMPGRPADAAERRAFETAWKKADQAYRDFKGPDRAFSEVLPALGAWRPVVESTEVLLSGRPLAEVSFADQPGDELYAGNHFIAGGYGTYLAGLAEGLPIRAGCAASAVAWTGRGVAVETAAGRLKARAVIVAVPTGILQTGGLRFSPHLPDEVAAALQSFRVGTYEHVVLHWPDAPFRDPDRFATLVGGSFGAIGLLGRIDGTSLHYMELNHVMVDAAEAGEGSAAFALDVLRDFFGAAALAGCEAIGATDWRRDPWSLGAWGVLGPGDKDARNVLTASVENRIWFAGEALAGGQIGTVGGAWSHGVRAATEVAAALT